MEIRKCILPVNRCVEAFRKHIKSQLIQTETKVLMYKILVRPVLTLCYLPYGMLPRSDERQLNTFERSIFRQIFGPMEERGPGRKGII